MYTSTFFSHTARPVNSLSVEYFYLTYHLNGISKIDRFSFTCRFCLNSFHVCFNLFLFLFLVTLMSCSDCWTLHGVNANQKYFSIMIRDWNRKHAKADPKNTMIIKEKSISYDKMKRINNGLAQLHNWCNHTFIHCF